MAISGVLTKEGVCRVETGWESDVLRFEPDGDSLAASDLIPDGTGYENRDHRYRVKIRVEWERVD